MKFKIENTIYNTPKSWDDVTLEQYVKLQYVLLDTEKDELDKKLELISVLCLIPTEIIEKCSMKNLNHIYDSLTFINQEPNTDIINSFYIENTEFYFDTNFERNLTFEQFSDLKYLINDDLHKNLHKIMAILIRKVVKKHYDFKKYKGLKKENYFSHCTVEPYDSNKLDELGLMMNQLPVSKIYGIVVFFWAFLSAYMKLNIHNYSDLQVKKA